MSDKPILVFDATILSCGNSNSASRSGIFWTSWNLFVHFARSSHFTLWLYCNPYYYHDVKKCIERILPGVSCTFVNSNLDCFTQLCGQMRSKKEYYKRQHRSILKTYYHILSVLFRALSGFIRTVQGSRPDQLKKVSYFFSPMYGIPREIQKYPHITKAIMLYDAMPITHPHFFPDGCPWIRELVEQLNTTDLYFTDSESARRDYLQVAPQIPPKHITTAYIATNQPYHPQEDPAKLKAVKEKYHIPHDKSYVFSLCTMEIRKNIPFAIDNFIAFCEQNHIQDQVLVLGGGSRDERLAKYKTSPYVKFIGYVDDEDLQTLYSAANVFVYPSLYEGFGMPILEAMSCGCPVICSNTSSMPEVLGDCGILIDPTQPAQYISALNKYYSDESFRKECVRKGLERAKQFSWEKCVDTITRHLLKD